MFGDAGHEAQEGGFAEVGAGEFAGEAALAHHEDAAAEADEFGEFGGDDEDGFAFEGEFVEELVNFGLGADVDAAGGFVDDENVALAGDPFGEGDFLLVAAAEGGDGSFERRGFDAEALGEAGGEVAFGVAADPAEAGELGERGEGGVLAAVHREDEALAFAVFGDEAEFGGERGAEGTERGGAAVERELAGGGGVEAEDGLRDFAAAGADEAGEADDFAGADGEVDIFK